jgi:hypothetical protein
VYENTPFKAGYQALIDATGLHPCHVSPLPAHPAAINQRSVGVQELTVRAALASPGYGWLFGVATLVNLAALVLFRWWVREPRLTASRRDQVSARARSGT